MIELLEVVEKCSFKEIKKNICRLFTKRFTNEQERIYKEKLQKWLKKGGDEEGERVIKRKEFVDVLRKYIGRYLCNSREGEFPSPEKNLLDIVMNKESLWYRMVVNHPEFIFEQKELMDTFGSVNVEFADNFYEMVNSNIL